MVRRPVEDEAELVDMKGAKGKADGIKLNLVVYALVVSETEVVNNSTVLKTVQEIAVMDEDQFKTTISLHNQACGFMKANQSHLFKNAPQLIVVKLKFGHQQWRPQRQKGCVSTWMVLI